MKPLSSTCSLALTLLLGSLGLVGCGGALSFPDAVVSPQVQGPPVQGSVYGGHAAIVGAHVYLLQPGTSGYGSAATSLLGKVGNTTVTSASGYAITANVNDPNVPVGAKYETSDSSGAFNLTGGYSCTVGQPVYLYSYGTSASTVTQTGGTTTANYTPSSIVVSNLTGRNGNETATYTVTVSTTESLTAGQTVTMSDFTDNNFTIIDGNQTVLSAGLTSTTFEFTATDAYGQIPTGTYSRNNGSKGFGVDGAISATVTILVPTTNPELELATLGVCPSSGNFSTAGNGALTYVYMNEVSTVATAYTFQPFTLASNNNAWDIGSSGTPQALVGIANAAETAAQLYDIEGASLISSTHDGEGHLANYQTQLNGVPNAGNGVVPQATIDTLANILAACIDSTPATGNVLSSQCTTLFNTATDNGQTLAGGGNAPTDTATAAINIARYPAGNNSGTADPTYVSDIFGIPTGTVPYAPELSSAPNDWTIAISYPSSLNASIGTPESIAVDASGNVFFSNQSSGYITKFLPTGALSWSYASGVTPGYLSVDPSNNVWYGAINNASSIYELTNAGALKAKSPVATFDIVSSSATDSSGNFYFVSATATGANAYEYTSTFGSPGDSPFSGSATCTPNYTGYNGYDHLAIDGSQTLWVSDEHSSQICRFSSSGAVYSTHFPIATGTYPEAISIDNSGSAWVALQTANEVDHITLSAGVPALSTLTSTSTGATFNAPFSTAVDGAGNIWVTNRSSNTIAELNSTGAAISPTINYQDGPGILNDPLNAAVDPSGNVWISNYGGDKVVELVGAATPTVTPLSYASGKGGLGNTP